MSELKLEPWEEPTSSLSPASGTADALVELEIRGQKRMFLLRGIRLRDNYFCAFAREKDSTSVGNWLLVGLRGPDVHVWQHQGPPLPEDVVRGIEAGDIELARFCVVAHGKQTRRALTRSNGESLWLSVDMINQEPFDLPLSGTAFFQDGRAHFECVKEELARPESDARFAANWLRWSNEKRQQHIFGESRLKEVQAVMRSLLQSEQWLWRWGRQWRWTLAVGRNSSSLPYDPQSLADYLDKRFLIFLDFSDLLINHFGPSSDNPELLAHRCVRKFTELWGFWPTVEVTTRPTMHEQLEARLYVREWFQQNAPERMDLLA